MGRHPLTPAKSWKSNQLNPITTDTEGAIESVRIKQMSGFLSNADWAIYLPLLDLVYLHFQAIFKQCLVKKYKLLCNIWIPRLKWRQLAECSADVINRLYQMIEKKGPVSASQVSIQNY